MSTENESLIYFEEKQGDYCITFTDFPEGVGGHEIEDAIKVYSDKNNIDADELEFDSESDMFSVSSENRDLLLPIESIINIFLARPDVLEEILEQIKNETDESEDLEDPRDYIEHLIYNEIDIKKPREILFYLEFQSEKKARDACIACVAEGFECLIRVQCGADVAAIIKMAPDIKALKQKIVLLKNIATDHEGVFDHYSDYEDEDLMKVFGHSWVIFQA